MIAFMSTNGTCSFVATPFAATAYSGSVRPWMLDRTLPSGVVPRQDAAVAEARPLWTVSVDYASSSASRAQLERAPRFNAEAGAKLKCGSAFSPILRTVEHHAYE